MIVLNHLLGREKSLSEGTQGDHNILIKKIVLVRIISAIHFTLKLLKWIALIILTSTKFLLGYCGHPKYPHSKIFLDRSSDLILSHFKEEDHSYIKDALSNKKIQLVLLYYVYKPNTNASRTKYTNNYEQAYKFCPLFGDESTGFHLHLISVVVFSYSETLESVLVVYAVTEMVFLHDSLDAAP